MRGVIFDIKRFSVNDGPGIRSTVFLKGCPLDCWWCHNPEGLSPAIEKAVRKDRLGSKTFEVEEAAGREVPVDEVMAEVLKDRVFYQESKGGVTFSGGEPLMQPEFLKELLEVCREQGIYTAVDTSGCCSRQELESIIDLVDLFLYDIKHLDDEAHLKYTGVSNRAILDNLRLLVERKCEVIVRFPVMPGINDGPEHLEQLKSFLLSLDDGVREIHLLPYHAIAKGKYQKFGRKYRLPNLKGSDPLEMKGMKQFFEQAGFTVRIGG